MRLQKNDILSFLPKGLIFYNKSKLFTSGIFLILLIKSLTSYSQSKSSFDVYLYKMANEKLARNDFYDAVPDFAKLIQDNPDNTDIQFKYGVCLTEAGKNQQKAIPYLKKTYHTGNYNSAFYLGKVYFNYMQFDSAHYYLNEFLKKATDKDLKKTDAKNMVDHLFDAMLLMDQGSKVKISNLENVNSSFADYSPIVKADGSVLYFTSKREDTKGEKKDENDQYFEDIYFSKSEDSIFQLSINVGSPLNSKEHDATVSLSADGNTMIIYRTDPYSGGGDLYMSKKEGSEWTMPFKLGFNINSEHLETSASISPDGKTIYFTSNRPGGFGGLDIYKSEKGKNGVWGLARNLGSHINSKFDEESPFINADQTTLYFSSKGHEPNMGGYDVFKSTLDSNNRWQKVANMNYPINTLKDDLYFTLTANSKTGFISSNRIDSKGDLDIYKFELEEKDPNITLVKGLVKEVNSNNAIKAEIEAIDRKTGQILFKQFSNPENGEFMVILPNNKDIKLVFEKGNAIFSELFDASGEKKFKSVYKIIELETR